MNRNMTAGIIILLLLFLASRSLFLLDETEQAIITEFGRPVGDAISEPGIHFKLPWRQARPFDRRFLEWNGDPNEVPTKDKKFLFVDTYARWRISDPLLFFQRVESELGALARLDDIIDGETRNVIAKNDLEQIVRSSNREIQIDPSLAADEQVTALGEIDGGRVEIMAEILTGSQGRAEELGIEVVDVRFKRINYNPTVRNEVYQRMITERQRIAERFRSEGEGESARILGEKERRLKEIESGAYRDAQQIVGDADAEATRIYADAYGTDPEFYQFLSTMETYPQTIDQNTWLVLGTDGDYLRFLQKPR